MIGGDDNPTSGVMPTRPPYVTPAYLTPVVPTPTPAVGGAIAAAQQAQQNSQSTTSQSPPSAELLAAQQKLRESIQATLNKVNSAVHRVVPATLTDTGPGLTPQQALNAIQGTQGQQQTSSGPTLPLDQAMAAALKAVNDTSQRVTQNLLSKSQTSLSTSQTNSLPTLPPGMKGVVGMSGGKCYCENSKGLNEVCAPELCCGQANAPTYNKTPFCQNVAKIKAAQASLQQQTEQSKSSPLALELAALKGSTTTSNNPGGVLDAAVNATEDQCSAGCRPNSCSWDEKSVGTCAASGGFCCQKVVCASGTQVTPSSNGLCITTEDTSTSGPDFCDTPAGRRCKQGEYCDNDVKACVKVQVDETSLATKPTPTPTPAPIQVSGCIDGSSAIGSGQGMMCVCPISARVVSPGTSCLGSNSLPASSPTSLLGCQNQCSNLSDSLARFKCMDSCTVSPPSPTVFSKPSVSPFLCQTQCNLIPDSESRSICLAGCPGSVPSPTPPPNAQCFTQTDTQWSAKPIGANGYTLGGSGCGPTTMANILCGMGKTKLANGQDLTPYNLANSDFSAMGKGGAYTYEVLDAMQKEGVPASVLFAWDVRYNAPNTPVQKNYWALNPDERLSAVQAQIEQGNQVMVAVPDLNGGGHWMLFQGYDAKTQTFQAVDPNWQQKVPGQAAQRNLSSTPTVNNYKAADLGGDISTAIVVNSK